MRSLRTQTLLIISITLAVAGVLAYGVLFRAMKRSNDQISLLVDSVKQNANARAEAISLKKLVDDVGPDIKKIDSYYIAPDGTVDFIEMIEQLGRDAGVTAEISRVEIHPIASSNTTEKLYLTVSFTGTWKSQVHFLSLLESLPYDLYFSRLSVINESHSDTPSKSLWQGKADLEILKLH